jgi:hypothetical protein
VTRRAPDGAERVAALRVRIGEASALLADGRRRLDEGGVPDLAPLVPTIEALTRDIAALPEGRGRPLGAALVALLDEMAGLSGRLVEERDRIGRQLQDESAHRRADAAYRGKG